MTRTRVVRTLVAGSIAGQTLGRPRAEMVLLVKLNRAGCDASVGRIRIVVVRHVRPAYGAGRTLSRRVLALDAFGRAVRTVCPRELRKSAHRTRVVAGVVVPAIAVGHVT